MFNRKWHVVLGPALAAAIPLAAYLYLRGNDSIDARIALPKEHFYIVSAVALLATIVAFTIGISGSRLRNIKVSFLALSFISLAEIFAVHGLSTPGFLLPRSRLPGIAAQMSVLLSVWWLWMSSLSSDHRLVLWFARWQRFLMPVWALFLAVCAAVVMHSPPIAELIPADSNPLKWLITALVLFLGISSIVRYGLAYRFFRFPLQISIVYSAAWLAVAQLIMVTGETWRISWWIYHFLLLFAMIVMLFGLGKQYADQSSLGLSVRSLFQSDPLERIEAGITDSVRALVVATEMKDRYTAGHNMRVAVVAMRIAEELGLSPEKLRALAQGGVVHDVGKIEVPDHILNKPDKLSNEERMIIERHPVTGYEMCKRLGFGKEELEVIRSHHERWDGTGYPDRLKGEDIPLLARIIAVADVYDALTSNRSYRQAWTHEQAMALLTDNAGIHFDPHCVQAWMRVCELETQDHTYGKWIGAEEKSFNL